MFVVIDVAVAIPNVVAAVVIILAILIFLIAVAGMIAGVGGGSGADDGDWEAGGGDGALGTAAGEKGDAPDLVLVRRFAEIRGQSVNLDGGSRALVDGVEQLREPSHAASPLSSVSPSNWVGTTCAAKP